MPTEHQQKIIDAYKANPTATFADLASPFGVTGARVRQIVTKAMRAEDPNWKKPTPAVTYQCKACGGTFDGPASTRYCPDHRSKGYVEGEQPKMLARNCLNCGTRFEISAAKVAAGAADGQRVGVYDTDACRLEAMKKRPIKKRPLK